MNTELLPTLNAILNGLAAVLLVAGYAFVRRRRFVAHRRCMLAAFGVSTLFLALYITHKVLRATGDGVIHTTYHGDGTLRVLYLAILLSHLLLAMAVPPLAIRLILLARAERLAQHRRLARVTLPLWLYVSITGVVIYVMLYHLNPDPASMPSAMRTP